MRRLEAALKKGRKPANRRRLPIVLRDDASQADIDRLTAGRLEAYRFSDFVDMAV